MLLELERRGEGRGLTVQSSTCRVSYQFRIYPQGNARLLNSYMHRSYMTDLFFKDYFGYREWIGGE